MTEFDQEGFEDHYEKEWDAKNTAPETEKLGDLPKGPPLEPPLVVLKFRTMVSGKTLTTLVDAPEPDVFTTIDLYNDYGWDLVYYHYAVPGEEKK